MHNPLAICALIIGSAVALPALADPPATAASTPPALNNNAATSSAASSASAPSESVSGGDGSVPVGNSQAGKHTELDPVTVKGKHDVFAEGQERLRKLKESLPEPGEGGKVRETWAQRTRAKVENFAKNDSANNRSDSGKSFMERSMDPLNAHAGEGNPTAQDGEDFKDKYCGTTECPQKAP